ncbi:folate receptor beta-like [Neocloeon triangulifer]|uniref:folate receptor beta-like n=1 Tax=Neocloeon triangulifer TaxID=2078957 RepID=UPI00286F72E2|nr:folate receptor beta-like [Neocloeon triangulifer]
MPTLNLIVVFTLGIAQGFCLSDEYDATLAKIMNRCIDSINHKPEPGVEAILGGQCAPWKNRSCCSHENQDKLHELKLYNFDFEHCSQKLSPKCRKHFIQDLCFYECSPNTGPWIVSGIKMKIRKERFYKVPLCQSDCEFWYDACQDDLTCIRNWIRDFEWKSGKNNCPLTSPGCKKFKHIWETAKDFCEEIWDHSWEVVPDNQNCMRLWFEGENPNDHVAIIKAYEMLGSKGTHFGSASLAALVALKLFLIRLV